MGLGPVCKLCLFKKLLLRGREPAWQTVSRTFPDFQSQSLHLLNSFCAVLPSKVARRCLSVCLSVWPLGQSLGASSSSPRPARGHREQGTGASGENRNAGLEARGVTDRNSALLITLPLFGAPQCPCPPNPEGAERHGNVWVERRPTEGHGEQRAAGWPCEDAGATGWGSLAGGLGDPEANDLCQGQRCIRPRAPGWHSGPRMPALPPGPSRQPRRLAPAGGGHGRVIPAPKADVGMRTAFLPLEM